MKDLFVDYDTALKLKELGFNEPCFGFFVYQEFRYWIKDSKHQYDDCKNSLFNRNEISAPLKSQFFKFIRDKYNLLFFVTPKEKNKFVFHVLDIKNYKNITYNDSNISGGIMLGEGVYYNTHEEAELKGINYLIKLIDEKV